MCNVAIGFRLFGVAIVITLLQACAGLPGAGSDALVLEDGTVFSGEPADQSVVQQALMAQFKEWRGTPYRLGGNTRAGIDCSAFVQQTLATRFNMQVPRTTAEQARLGVEVDRNDLQVGDLVFFRTGYSTRHVGFYLGSGRFLHASTKVGVTINNLDDLYWRKTFWKVRRLL